MNLILGHASAVISLCQMLLSTAFHIVWGLVVNNVNKSALGAKSLQVMKNTITVMVAEHTAK